jgi:hypothetical protein
MKHLQTHIGHLIFEKLDENGQKASWLADKICCSRPHIYRVFNNENMSIAALWRVSHALHFDFFAHLSAEFQSSEQTKPTL